MHSSGALELRLSCTNPSSCHQASMSYKILTEVFQWVKNVDRGISISVRSIMMKLSTEQVVYSKTPCLQSVHVMLFPSVRVLNSVISPPGCKVGKTSEQNVLTWDRFLFCLAESNYNMASYSWLHHQMEMFSMSLALCEGNLFVTSGLPGQWRGALIFSLICLHHNTTVKRRYNAVQFYRHITYGTAITVAESELDIRITTDTPYLAAVFAMWFSPELFILLGVGRLPFCIYKNNENMHLLMMGKDFVI